jgi:hypothetical protein
MLLPITTAAVATEVIRLDTIFFHAVGADTLTKGNFCIAKSTCRGEFLAIRLGSSFQQEKTVKKTIKSVASPPGGVMVY